MDGLLVVEPEALVEVPLERIEEEITGLAAHLAAAECRWLVLIGEFDRREGFSEWGCRSTAHYLNWRVGVSMRTAFERVRVGRTLLGLPVLRGAFSRGELSYSKVRAVTKMACRENDAELVELARHATAAQIERIAAGVSKVRSRDRAAAKAHVERYLHYSWDADGSLLIWAKIPPEHGAVVLEALRAVIEEIDLESFVAGHDTETNDVVAADDECSAEHSDEPTDPDDRVDPSDPWSARQADALVRMAETVLANGAAARTDRFQVAIHGDLDALYDPDGDGTFELPNGTTLARSTVERILCDCDTVPVLELDGTPIDTGKKSPNVARRQRRQVTARDRHCRFPGCTEARYVDVHHIVWQSRGGPTEVWNLLLLCRFHHRLIHQHHFKIQGTHGDVTFHRPDGTPIDDAPGIQATGPGIVEQHRIAGLTVDPETITSRWDGSPLDPFGLNLAVEQFATQLEQCSAEHQTGCPHADEPVAA